MISGGQTMRLAIGASYFFVTYGSVLHYKTDTMYAYETVVEAVQGLKQRGYTIDFNLEAGRIFCPKTPLALKPADFEIIEFYRFEGPSDPADEAAVYAIESRSGEKGVLVTGFGISAEGVGEEMIEKLSVKR